MGAGTSSESESRQTVESLTKSNISSGCSFICENNMRDIKVDATGSIGADITFDQKCVVNPNCLINSTSDIMADIAMKAKNSANAEAKQGLSFFDINKSKSKSIQDVRSDVINNITTTCDMKAINNMEHIEVVMADSIGGTLNFLQSGMVKGKCSMKNSAKAVNKISQDASNRAQAGGKSSKTNMIMWIVIAMVTMAFAGILAKMLSNKNGSAGTGNKVSLGNLALLSMLKK